MNQAKLVKRFIIGTFVTLYTLVSVISTIHVIDFFALSNPYWLAVTLAIGFELGAAASLASLVILDKMNKTLVWALFITITLMQMQGNMYYAFTNLQGFQSWAELFDLIEEELIYQKRILAFVSGAILPLVALGFIKSLVDYIKPEDEGDGFTPEDSSFDDIEESDELTEEQIRQAEDDLDRHREEILGRYKDDIEIAEDFDDDLSDQFEAEDDAWEVTLNDGLEDEDWDDEDWDDEEWDDEDDEDDEEWEGVGELADSINEKAADDIIEEVVSGEEEDLLEQAKRRLAEENKEKFLKDKKNGSGDTV